jgi:hypothetical protein
MKIGFDSSSVVTGEAIAGDEVRNPAGEAIEFECRRFALRKAASGASFPA